MERHIALLIDILGFSEAVVAQNVDQTDALLHFIERISELQGKFNLDGESLPDGSYRFHGIRPEVTTFSDLLFASFPLPVTEPQLTPLIANMWLQEAERWTAAIAVEALKVGMLIRGGLALGALHHDQERSITLGPALVEAHAIEARDAIYPRVLLSPNIVAELEADQLNRLLRDKDGLHHLNYFSGMFDYAVTAGPDFLDKASAWLRDRVEVIDENARALSGRGRTRQAAKWEWFKSEFLAAARRRGVNPIDRPDRVTA